MKMRFETIFFILVCIATFLLIWYLSTYSLISGILLSLNTLSIYTIMIVNDYKFYKENIHNDIV